MSAFLEKLTASRPKESEDDTRLQNEQGTSKEIEVTVHQTEIQSEPRRNSAVPSSSREPGSSTRSASEARRGRIETGQQYEPEVAGEDTAEEEEGELTVDIYEKDAAIVIQSTVAGVKPENLEVSITSDMVRIKGTRQPPDHILEEHYYYKELFWGTFARTVILPEEIDEHHTEATLTYGLLTITLPKKKKGLAQKVKIKTI